MLIKNVIKQTLCLLALSGSFGFSGAQALQKLAFMEGNWQVETLQRLVSGDSVLESGTAQISYVLSKSYLKLEVELCTVNGCRSYIQLISYDKHTDLFLSTYFYSGTVIKVEERGTWQSNALELTGINPWSSEQMDGINIVSTYQPLDETRFQLEVDELRRGQWDVGYKSIFHKVQ